MNALLTPPWLVAAAGAQPRSQGASRGNGGKGATSAVPPAQPRKPRVKLKQGIEGIVEPTPWPFDGCRRRAQVLDHDHNPPRLIRHVGWRHCMSCAREFWSQDVIALRICDRCKGNDKLSGG